jgi:hypothetical protein
MMPEYILIEWVDGASAIYKHTYSGESYTVLHHNNHEAGWADIVRLESSEIFDLENIGSHSCPDYKLTVINSTDLEKTAFLLKI